MVLTAEIWAMMIFTIAAFWGVAGWALVRTLRQEERKAELLDRQHRLDTYSPRALDDLREWIEDNPEDPYVEETRARYNECVEALRATDRQSYDWDRGEIESLEKI